jgi:hypothetical protein
MRYGASLDRSSTGPHRQIRLGIDNKSPPSEATSPNPQVRLTRSLGPLLCLKLAVLGKQAMPMGCDRLLDIKRPGH